MLRKWFCLVAVFATAVVLMAPDTGESRERRRQRRQQYYNDYATYNASAGTTQPAADTEQGVRRSFYTAPGTPGSLRAMPVYIDVVVPPSAEITFDGKKTAQTGPSRSFFSLPLTPGQTFTYEIKAMWVEDGQPKTSSRKLDVRSGERLLVDLTKPVTPNRED